MTPREYAISLGLAKEGRGKLSHAAHEAIDQAKANGMTFDDPSLASIAKAKEKVQAKKPKAEEIVKSKKVRKQNKGYIIVDGLKHGFAFCRCTQGISNCKCKPGPYAPDFLGGGLLTLE